MITSIYPSIYLSPYPSIHLPIYPSINLYLHQSIYRSIYLVPTHLSNIFYLIYISFLILIYPSIYPLVCHLLYHKSFYSSISKFIYLSIYSSFYLSFYLSNSYIKFSWRTRRTCLIWNLFARNQKRKKKMLISHIGRTRHIEGFRIRHNLTGGSGFFGYGST